MKQYTPEKLVAVSRYKTLFPTLSPEIQRDVYSRMRVLIEEEKQWCDQGNYKHLAQILTTIALYEVLQQHGKSEPEAFKIISEAMWAALTPKTYQKMARLTFFLPAMKKILPFGFRYGSGAGWRYTWHLDEDPKDRFHFECRECLYKLFDILLQDQYVVITTQYFVQFYPETRECASWHDRSFNTRNQLIRIAVIPFICALLAGLMLRIGG